MTASGKAILNYLILSYIAYHDLNNAAIYHDVDDMNIWLSEYEHFNLYPYGGVS